MQRVGRITQPNVRVSFVAPVLITIAGFLVVATYIETIVGTHDEADVEPTGDHDLDHEFFIRVGAVKRFIMHLDDDVDG